MSVLSARDLRLSYGERAVLKGVSFEVREGEFFVIIGPNGAGKTSLLKLLAGLERASAGEVSLFGKPLSSFSRREIARRVALVPQQVPLEFPFTVGETVLMGRSPHLGLMAFERTADLETARRAMRFTGVEDLASRRLDELSGGERQRVIIARALCQEPRVILLDEPTSALDPAHQVRVMDLMERMRREYGTTVVMVSHDLNLAAMYGDRLLLLGDGRVECEGRPAEVLTYPRIEASYGCLVLVDENPLGQVPRVTLVPEKFSRPAAPKKPE